MPSKKFLQERVAYLEGHAEGMDQVTDMLNDKIADLELNNAKLVEERDKWRIKAELLYHTPEVKVDTEAAYKRGAADTTAKFRAWFLTTAQNIGEVIKDSNEK